MKQLSGEQTLREAGSPGSSLYFVLTTHRVRLKQQVLGRGEIVSLMLDQVSSCAVAQRSRPLLLALAALAVLAGLFLTVQGNSTGPLITSVIVAGILWGVYLLTRQQVLELRSSGATAAYEY
jgi:hypothetical protein